MMSREWLPRSQPREVGVRNLFRLKKLEYGIDSVSPAKPLAKASSPVIPVTSHIT